MDTNKLILPELSYTITGICFSVHNELGRFEKEKKYGDLIEKKLKESNINYRREIFIGSSGNIADFLIEGVLILELKAKRTLVKNDFIQTQNYLQQSGVKLGILINFRNCYIKPVRIVRIEHNYSKLVV